MLTVFIIVSTSQACKSRNTLEDDSFAKASDGNFKLTDTEEKILDLYKIRDFYDQLKAEEKQEILERFIYAADSIHLITGKAVEKLGNADSESKVKGLAQAFQTYRSEFFRTEGLLRIYRKIDQYKPFLAPLFTNELKTGLGKDFGIKQMEDALGKFGEANMNLEFASKLNASPSALKALSQIKANADESLKKLMLKDWIVDRSGRIPYFARLFSTLEMNRSRLLHNQSDNAQVIDIFSDELKDFNEKELDYNDLEEGFHELRRNLRWIPILIVSFDGLILPDLKSIDSGVSEYNEIMKLDSVTKGKYFQALKMMRRPKAFRKIPISLFAAAAYYAEQIGYVKDIWQNYHALVQAYTSSNNMDHSTAEKAVKDLFFKAGYKEASYSPGLVKDLATTKPPILLDFPPLGRAIDEITKGKQKNIFKKISSALK